MMMAREKLELLTGIRQSHGSENGVQICDGFVIFGEPVWEIRQGCPRHKKAKSCQSFADLHALCWLVVLLSEL